jgi:hypothetical protein
MSLWGLEISDISSSSLLGVCVILILLGRLVPRSTYKDKADETERWRSAYEMEREARAAAEAQTQELLERTKAIHDNLSVKRGDLQGSDAES